MRIGIALAIGFIVGAVLFSSRPAAHAEAANAGGKQILDLPNIAPEGFSPKYIRFDESMGDKKPTPAIPKDWRLIAVSNGNAINANNLWFSTPTGEIYMLSGFSDREGFTLNQRVEKIHITN